MSKYSVLIDSPVWIQYFGLMQGFLNFDLM